MIAVILNGEDHRFSTGATVEELVDWLCDGLRGVAVVVNSDVVPRSAWNATFLVPGDRIEILRAAQGG